MKGWVTGEPQRLASPRWVKESSKVSHLANPKGKLTIRCSRTPTARIYNLNLPATSSLIAPNLAGPAAKLKALARSVQKKIVIEIGVEAGKISGGQKE